VALHRAHRLARDLGPGSTVLLSSYVRTLPPILGNLFTRLAGELNPDEHGEVEFRHIVEIAKDVVARHEGSPPRLENDKARSLFQRVWDQAGPGTTQLGARGVTADYLWDEIGKVILGRMVRRFEDYADLKRHGRRLPLKRDERKAVWSLFTGYAAACIRSTPRVYDQDSLILRAYELLSQARVHVDYDAVVVDEAQDLTAAALAMLLHLTQGGRNGSVFLTGDGGQRIYPGGYRLTELGIDIRGRSFVLRDAYRSTTGILEWIGRLGRLLSADDFGADGLGTVAVRAVRDGNPPTVRRFETREEQASRIAELLRTRPSERLDSTAVLLPTNSTAREWRRTLKDLGIRTTLLEEYDGTPTPGVKVGTYSRSKGLEFVSVFLPDVAEGTFPSVPIDHLDEYLLQGSWFYIAMARARDELVITYVGEASYLIQEMIRPTASPLVQASGREALVEGVPFATTEQAPTEKRDAPVRKLIELGGESEYDWRVDR
jgi:superfamily I DNA/RNA helicase